MNTELTSLFDANTFRSIYNVAVANSQEILKESKSTKLELVNKLIIKVKINKIIIPEVMAGYNDALAQKKTCEQIIENLKKTMEKLILIL